MTVRYTIDANVWVCANSPAEPDYRASRQLLNDLLAHNVPLVAPTLLLVEIAGAIARTRNDTRLGLDLAADIRNLINVLVPLDTGLAMLAADLAATYRLRGADAVYGAIAVQYETILVSLDHEHLTRLPPSITVLKPATALSQLSW